MRELTPDLLDLEALIRSEPHNEIRYIFFGTTKSAEREFLGTATSFEPGHAAKRAIHGSNASHVTVQTVQASKGDLRVTKINVDIDELAFAIYSVL